MFASFRRLGQRDMKTLAKHLHQLLMNRQPQTLADCQDVVAQLHGYPSWIAAEKQSGVKDVLADPSVMGHLLKNGRVTNTEFRLPPSHTHLPQLLLGETGSGRTETLISMLKGVIDQGQGGIYVDAQGDVGVAQRIMSHAAAAGRSDDVRVIQLLVEEERALQHWINETETPSGRERRMSHTYNPLESASVEEVKRWWLPMCEAVWKEAGVLSRCIDVLREGMEAWLGVLVSGRDRGLWPLDLGVLLRIFDDQPSHWALVHNLSIDRFRVERLLAWMNLLKDDHVMRGWDALGNRVRALHRCGAYRAKVTKRPEGWVWSSADLDWKEAIEGKKVVVILLPDLWRHSRMEEVQAAWMWLFRPLLDVLAHEDHAHIKKNLMGCTWIIDRALGLDNQGLLRLIQESRKWGLKVVVGETGMRSDPVSADLQEQLVSQIGTVTFMRLHDAAAFSPWWPGLKRYAQEIQQQGPGEAHVYLSGQAGHSATWTKLMMAYYPNLTNVTPLPQVPGRWVRKSGELTS